MTADEIRDVNDVVVRKLVEMFGGAEPEQWKLVFRHGEFLGVEVGKCFVEADDFELGFV